MALWIQISIGTGEAVYSQLVSQISQAIAKGQLSAGDKLPPVRKLASELVINPNTVAKAYSQLELSGLVVTKTGSGTYIADRTERSIDISQMNILVERIDNIIARAINLGIKISDLAQIFQERLKKFNNQPRNSG